MPEPCWKDAINFDTSLPLETHSVLPLSPSLGQELVLCFLKLVSFSTVVTLVGSPNGPVTSRRQVISLNITPMPHESLIGHLPGVTGHANCCPYIISFMLHIFTKRPRVPGTSQNKNTASRTTHPRSFLSAWAKWSLKEAGWWSLLIVILHIS